MLQLLLLFSGLAAAGAIAVAFTKRKYTPEQQEQMRRAYVNSLNRVIEGDVTDASHELVQYHYELRGIEYHASQDVRALRSKMPEDPVRLIGPVSVKFEPSNPANSIVVCEEWAGWEIHHQNQGGK